MQITAFNDILLTIKFLGVMRVSKESKKIKVLNRFDLSFYILFFLAITLIAFFFPPSADDLGWATSQGAELFRQGFKDYNGRYLGNIFALVFTRLPRTLPFIKSLTLTGVLFFIRKISCDESKEFLCLTAFLLAVPSSLFKQGFVWTAGFSNYYFSALIIVVSFYLLLFKDNLTGRKNFLRIALIFILGISGQLFMETYTIFCLVFAIVFNIYYFVKNKKIQTAAMVYFFSCVIGAIIMFTNGVYLKVLRGENTYQSVAVEKSFAETILSLITKLFGEVSLRLVTACFPVIVIISGISIALFRKNFQKNSKKVLLTKIIFASVAIGGIALAVEFFIVKDFEILKLFAGLFLLSFFGFSSIVLSDFKNRKARNRVLIYLLMVVVQCGPLVIVSPVGTRCFAGTYLIFILAVREFFEEYKLSYGEIKFYSEKILLAVLILLFSVNLFCYTQVFFANNRKIDYIRSEVQKGNYSIELESTPFNFLIYSLDVEHTSEKFKQRFCEYYHLPYEIEINYK